MGRYGQIRMKGKSLFLGIDLDVIHWHLTIRTEDVELFGGSIPGSWGTLRKLLDRRPGSVLHTVYDAGYFGFWLHDLLVEYSAECVVTPPSLLPMEYGNKVITDRPDRRKLAQLLAKGMLKRVWVPSLEERFYRQVIRRRRQLIADRLIPPAAVERTGGSKLLPLRARRGIPRLYVILRHTRRACRSCTLAISKPPRTPLERQRP